MNEEMISDMISIIIPVYNSELYLSECMESVISQTYRNIEIICIDDSSTDRSIEILEKYAKKDNRIRIVKKKNEGVSLARNKGLDISKGEYILFVDSDDWIEKATCEKVIKNIIDANADVVMWPYIREQEGKSRKKRIFDKNIIFTEKEVKKRLHRRMIGIIDNELTQPENADALCTVWGKLYRKSIIYDNKIEFYDIRKIGFYEDGIFNLLYFQYVQKAVFLNQYFYHYRRTNKFSITESYNEKLEKQWKNLFNILDNYVHQNNLTAEYKEALQNRIALSLIPLGINAMQQEGSIKKKIKNIKQLVSRKEYMYSVRKLKLEYMPLYWKTFFKAAQSQNAFLLYFLLNVIQKIRGR